jgi:hypothetical protein
VWNQPEIRDLFRKAWCSNAARLLGLIRSLIA